MTNKVFQHLRCKFNDENLKIKQIVLNNDESYCNIINVRKWDSQYITISYKLKPNRIVRIHFNCTDIKLIKLK